MTPEAKREIRSRLDGITKGTWEADPEEYSMFVIAPAAGMICEMRGHGGNLPVRANQKFIAHAPADIRALLDALEFLQSEADENARIIGMSGELELALRTKVAERDALLDEFRELGHRESCGYCPDHGDDGCNCDTRCSLCKKIDALKEAK